MTLQIVTIFFLSIIVLVSVIVGSRAHQKEREETEKKFLELKLINRSDRIYSQIKGIKPINTDPIVTDVLYDFYLDTLKELLNYSNDPESIEQMIDNVEEERHLDLAKFETRPALLSFPEKSRYKEKLTKLAKLLLYMRRKARISHTHYQVCYDYLRWLNLSLQINRQLYQANTNFDDGETRVAHTLYGVILSHLNSTSVDRPEKHELEAYITQQIKLIYQPQLEAIENAETPEEAAALIEDLTAGQSQVEAQARAEIQSFEETATKKEA